MFDITIDWERLKRSKKEDKDKMLKYISELIILKNSFDEIGIHCFENYSQEHADNFEMTAIDLICQGCMPDVVSMILSNLIQSTSLSDMQYMKQIVFTSFILMLQKGTFSSYDMKRILISYLGTEYSPYILTKNL